MISKSQGIGRLVIGLLFAAWACATIYTTGDLTLGVVYLGAFGLGWLGARAWLRSSGRWRAPLGIGWLAAVVALSVVISNVLHKAASPQAGDEFAGLMAALGAGLSMSIWFSPSRFERFQ